MSAPPDPRAEAEAAFLADVRPPGWPVPVPTGPYHLLVIGGGPAGLLAAHRAASLGAKVALIERHRLGGNSLHQGSVPTKTMLRTGRFYADLRAASLFGARPQTPAPAELELILARARRVRDRIAQVQSASKLKAAGVDLYFGAARFTGADRVALDGIDCASGRP